MGEPSGASTFLSQADFARRRGVSRKAVTAWKQKGLLVVAETGLVDVVRSEWNLDQRPPTYRGGVTHRPVRAVSGNNRSGNAAPASKASPKPEARPAPPSPADAEWSDDFDPDAPDLPLSEAIRRKENHLGLLRKQEFEQKGHNLVDRSAAERLFFESARDLRDAWLSWPARVSVIMASELKVDARTLTTALTAHVQQHLSELGDPTADLAQD